MILDAIDRKILAVLQRNARTPVSEIARSVDLSSAPVSRRIDRLERCGVITGYVAMVDDSQSGTIDAFTEVRLVGSIDVAEIEALVQTVPEVQQYFAISGDPDVIVRCRVGNIDHLQRVVNAIRRSGKVAGTKTLIVMSSWDRAAISACRPE